MINHQLSTDLDNFLFPIFKSWETFFLPQQIKEVWFGRQRPDQLSQAAISTVLSFWHSRKIWALSKAGGAISQPTKLFSSILLHPYLPLLIFFSPAIIPLPYFTLSFPSIFPPFSSSFNPASHHCFFKLSIFSVPSSVLIVHSFSPSFLYAFPYSRLLYFDKCHLVKIPAGCWSLKVKQLCWKKKAGSPVAGCLIERRIPHQEWDK